MNRHDASRKLLEHIDRLPIHPAHREAAHDEFVHDEAVVDRAERSIERLREALQGLRLTHRQRRLG